MLPLRGAYSPSRHKAVVYLQHPVPFAYQPLFLNQFLHLAKDLQRARMCTLTEVIEHKGMYKSNQRRNFGSDYISWGFPWPERLCYAKCCLGAWATHCLGPELDEDGATQKGEGGEGRDSKGRVLGYVRSKLVQVSLRFGYGFGYGYRYGRLDKASHQPGQRARSSHDGNANVKSMASLWLK